MTPLPVLAILRGMAKAATDKWRDRVEVLIQDDNNQILLGKDKQWNTWTLPGGGIDPGEDIVEAAKREAAEEVGINIKPIKILNGQTVKSTGWRKPNDKIIGDITHFVLAKPVDNKKTENFGSEGDALKDIGFKSYDEALSHLNEALQGDRKSQPLYDGRFEALRNVTFGK